MALTGQTSTNAIANDRLNRADNLPLPLLVEDLAEATKDLKVAQKRVDEINSHIAKRVASEVAKARAELQKTEGTVTVAVDGCEVKSTVPKNVKWDQNALSMAAAKIAELGEDPMQYIDFEASIPERKWEVLPRVIRELAIGARLLKHGKEKIEVTVIDG